MYTQDEDEDEDVDNGSVSTVYCMSTFQSAEVYDRVSIGSYGVHSPIELFFG